MTPLKRIILLYQNGLHQIHGCFDPATMETYPVIQPFINDRLTPFTLYRITPRTVMYQEKIQV